MEPPVEAQVWKNIALKLRVLRATRSIPTAELVKAVRPNVSRATLYRIMRGESTPERGTFVKILQALGIEDAAQQVWLDAWEKVRVNSVEVGRGRGGETDQRIEEQLTGSQADEPPARENLDERPAQVPGAQRSRLFVTWNESSDGEAWVGLSNGDETREIVVQRADQEKCRLLYERLVELLDECDCAIAEPKPKSPRELAKELGLQVGEVYAADVVGVDVIPGDYDSFHGYRAMSLSEEMRVRNWLRQKSSRCEP